MCSDKRTELGECLLLRGLSIFGNRQSEREEQTLHSALLATVSKTTVLALKSPQQLGTTTCMCVHGSVSTCMRRGTWVTYLGRGRHREQQWWKFNFLVAIEEWTGAWLNRCECEGFPLIQLRLYTTQKNRPPGKVFLLTLFYVLNSVSAVCVCVSEWVSVCVWLSKTAAAEFSRYKRRTVVSLKIRGQKRERKSAENKESIRGQLLLYSANPFVF